MDWLIVAAGSAAAGGLFGQLTKSIVESAAERRRILTPAQIEQRRASQILEQCCKVQAPGVMVVLGSSNALPCRLYQADEAVLRLWVAAELSKDAGLAVQAMTIVQFNVQGRARLFLAPIIALTQDEAAGAFIDVAWPSQLADGETRGAYRVSMTHQSPLHAVLLVELTDINAEVLDLSATGLGLRLPREHGLNMEVGDEVELRLELHGKSMQRSATVQRLQDDICGLALHPSPSDQASEDEVTYLDFVRHIIDLEGGGDA